MKWKEECKKCIQKNNYPRSFFDNSKKNYKNKKDLFTGIKDLTIITPSEWLAKQVRKSFLRDYDIKVINNGINLDIFRPTKGKEFCQKYTIPENKKIILGVASIWSEKKGIEDFIRLSKIIKDEYVILLVGKNKKIKKLKKLQLNNIVFIDRTENQKDLAYLYTIATCFVNPTYEDTFPNVNIEALACGTPIITYNTGGSVEIVDKDIGVIVEKENVQCLKKNIENIEKNEYIINRCINIAKKYDEDIKYKEYIEIYNIKQKRKLNVLYTTNIPSPYRIDFFNEFGKYCNLTVTIERNSASNRNKEWNKYNVLNFKLIKLKGINFTAETAFCPNILKVIKEGTFDFIIVGGYSTLTGMYLIHYLSKHKIPFIMNTDGGIINYNEKKILYRIKRYFISKASYWLSTGEKTDKYLEYYGAIKDNIYHYNFTSIRSESILKDRMTYSEKKIIKENENINNENVIISVGDFIYRKGFDILIKATKFINDDAIILIVGGKPTEEYLELIRNLNITNIKFIDFLDTKTLEKYYEISDVFVLPTREDIWGLVINEAMAKGLPIVTTNRCIAGTELIKNNENGYIVDVNDYRALANKINFLIKNKEIREKMSLNNIKKIKQYTIENMAIRHFNIIKEIKKESKI